jgi:hypothetical protein
MMDYFDAFLRTSGGLSREQLAAARADDAPSEAADRRELEVLCVLHGWEPEDADCNAAATDWRVR